MPVVRVSMFAGKSVEVKRKLVERLTDAVVEATSVTADHAFVYLNELPKDAVGVGGKPASETPPR